jgi:hypothetical protein
VIGDLDIDQVQFHRVVTLRAITLAVPFAHSPQRGRP